MNINEFDSPLPKPWLNINCNSLHVSPGGGGVSSCQYSQLSSVIISNVLSGSLTNGATHTGTLTLPVLPVGSIVKFTLTGFLSLNALNSKCNFSLIINGSPVGPSTAMTGPGAANIDSDVKIEAYLTIRGLGSAAGSIFCQVGASSGFDTFFQTGGASLAPFFYPDLLTTNTIDVFAIFNSAAVTNSFTCNSAYLELINAN